MESDECLTLRSVLPRSPSPEQQSVHAKEATEDMEMGILKTCQSVNDLRREVSSSLRLDVSTLVSFTPLTFHSIM